MMVTIVPVIVTVPSLVIQNAPTAHVFRRWIMHGASTPTVPPVTILSAVNTHPTDRISIEEQKQHRLRNMYKHGSGIKGGRKCTLCWSGAGYFSTNGQKFRRQIGWRCIKCERYMCQECYLLYPKHAGFAQVFYE
eukprot:TRINITY_DN3373_c0_g1_i2.p1 TRINITY_DN3373_c0_g1~~TRINITY_DN3373_c0_g1_i2.p1  ORF type:complete len:135 (+),score=1.31 TRINITY_DN3373_c0_g1_i2:313-717(+)